LLPRDANQLPECESADDFASQLTSFNKQVREARKSGHLSAQEQKSYFDAKVVHVNMKVGDRVYKLTPRGRLGKATKLLHHYQGPFGVLELGWANAKIKRLGVDTAAPEIVHLNRLKLFFGESLSPEYFSLGSMSKQHRFAHIT